MKIPQLSKKSETKSCHNVTWTDDYSWVHQKNILEVLKDSSKLLPEVRKYLEEENKIQSTSMVLQCAAFLLLIQDCLLVKNLWTL